MLSENRKKAYGKLPPEDHQKFIKDVKAGLTDVELAEKYDLRERTATNWRLRLVGSRKGS